MSISTTIDFWCDRCGLWTHFCNVPKVTVQRSQAKKDGWTREKDASGKKQDVCPACNKTKPSYWSIY